MSEKTQDDELREVTEHLRNESTAGLRDFLVVLRANTAREGDKVVLTEAINYCDQQKRIQQYREDAFKRGYARELALRTRQRELFATIRKQKAKIKALKEGEGS